MENEDQKNTVRYDRTKSGRYVLRDAKGRLITSTDYPTILFDRSTGTLHRHGDFLRVRRIAAELRSQFAKTGSQDIAANLVLYGSRSFDLVELNRCVCVEGYCLKFYERISKQ